MKGRSAPFVTGHESGTTCARRLSCTTAITDKVRKQRTKRKRLGTIQPSREAVFYISQDDQITET